jgi:chromosome segregation ATPase
LKFRSDELTAQNADFAAFAHVHNQVYSRDPQWADAEKWQNTIAAATSNFNSQLETTGQAIQNFYKFLSEKQLYQRQEPSAVGDRWPQQANEWHSSVQEVLESFKVHQSKMQTWYDRQPASQRPPISKLVSPLSDLHHDVMTLTQLIKEFDDLTSEFQHKYSNLEQITNLDPQWKSWQELQKRHARLLEQLERTKIRATETLENIEKTVSSS